MSDHILALAGIALIAAVVNGALGYGFSSLTVPLALLFHTNRTLNPALVPVEIVLNAYVLWVNRRAARHVIGRVLPVIVGLAPGIIAGTTIVARVSPAWVKLGTFVALLPLILLQAAGYRRRIRSERSAGGLFGAGIGILYAITTVSGPPLALALNNQGLAKEDFRAALGMVRLAESTLAAVAYAAAGLYSPASVALIPVIAPGVIVGVPLGAWIIRRVHTETFRRVCMSFDAWVVAFGISTVLRELGLATSGAAISVLTAVMLIDGWLLYRYFSNPRRVVNLAPGTIGREAYGSRP